MKIDEFLSSDAFTIVNKKLAKNVGIGQAIFLQELISQRRRFNQDEFYFTQNDMEDELGISPNTQGRYGKELKEKGLINITKKGIPARNYYTINDDKIINLISNGQTSATKMVELDTPKGCDYYNNKIIENKKTNKGNQNFDKLDDKLLDALQEFREMRKMIKKPLTSRAEKRLIAKLDKLGKNDDEKIDILHQSIDHCWQDIYELQTNKNNTQNKQTFPLEEIKQAAVSYGMYYQKKPEFAKPYAEFLKKYGLLDNGKRKEYANMILGTGFIS